MRRSRSPYSRPAGLDALTRSEWLERATAKAEHEGSDHFLSAETKTPALFLLSPGMQQAAASRFTGRADSRSPFAGNFVKSW